MIARRTIYAADLFCGAGGTSTGLVQAAAALGLDIELLAINHDETAVETHAANHPEANHLCASLDRIDPNTAIKRRRLDLLVASPECTHHSSARGGKPRNEQSRASAWHVLHWCERLRVENVLIENVPEFRTWGPLGANGKPLKRRKGETFRAFFRALESLGYRVEMRVLNCADFGDATTRRRLFIVATRGGRRPTWPDASHQESACGDLSGGGLGAWRPARDVIDWRLPSRSIFGRERPLATKTVARIAEGLRRYGGEAIEPFLLTLTHGGRIVSLDRPLPTITGANRGELALCEPFVIGQHGGSVARATSAPLPTVATKGAIQLVQPFIVPRYGERDGQAPRTHSIERPMPTIPATNQHGICEPFLISYYGTGGPKSVDRPLPAVTTKDRFGVVQTTHLDIHLRMLQPHELAAAMSFPAGYRFAGTKTAVVKQIGNAVPVRTARALCDAALRRTA